jgi:hypothetical protein
MAHMPKGNMTMNNAIATNGKLFSPIQPVPDNAPPPPVSLDNPNLSAGDLLVENYFGMESLQSWLDVRNAESRLLTITAVTVEFLFDPQTDPRGSSGQWKPVLWFAETSTGLVINKTRSEQLRRLTGSPLLGAWARVGVVAIKPGIANGHAQIVITAVPSAQEPARPGNGRDAAEYTIQDANDDLFGK